MMRGSTRLARVPATRRLCAWAAAWLSLALLAAPAPAQETAPVEEPPRTTCWRGWGYLLDGATGGYKSQEMLLVTIGSPLWEAGRPVELFLLDRASGLISEMPSFTVTPENPRLYYRGRLNYVDTTAAITGSQDRIVIGLSHIEPAKDGVPEKERYNRWACGFPEE
ncbi:hypothetical protein [Pelagibius sp. 7325]|uniref:hypothetical protein n=1 Tax=Pelagibius sp. 7325 TaxID=3131994 RepID=UPI0030EF3344